jgi:hypothetical protein
MQAAKDFYASGKPVVAPYQAFNHYDTAPRYPMQAIVFGDVYTGSAYPTSLQDRAFVSNLTTGDVYTVSTLDPAATIEKLTTYGGTIVFMDQGPDGLMYYADISNGRIGRWQITTTTTTAATTSAVESSDDQAAWMPDSSVDLLAGASHRHDFLFV